MRKRLSKKICKKQIFQLGAIGQVERVRESLDLVFIGGIISLWSFFVLAMSHG